MIYAAAAGLLLLVDLTWAIPLKFGEDTLADDARVKGNGVAVHVSYWWLPGSNQTVDSSISSVSCGDPGIPAFGSSLFQSLKAGSLVVHSCNQGYKLVGAKLRLCQSNGQWTPEIPSCVYADCGDPGTPFQGSRQISSNSLDSIVEYSCNKGFRLNGNGFRQCQENGQWTGSLPTCQAVGCPSLEVSNCKVQVKSQGVGAVATFVCLPGYTLVGSSSMTCGGGGNWLGKLPTCKLLQCENITPPMNGDVNIAGLSIGSTATYTCFPGFSMVGMTTRQCQQDGTWSGSPPVCQAITCDILLPPDNGSISINGNTVGSMATYRCFPGYDLQGAATVRCQNNGQWSSKPPTCSTPPCDQLQAPLNGNVVTSGINFGDMATYSCNAGYFLVGQASQTCGLNGQWTGTTPFCQGASCRTLLPPQNGDISFSNGLLYGSLATYTCVEGAVLVGDAARICSSNEQWSGVDPTCDLGTKCPRPPTPTNGLVDVTGLAVGAVARYTCNSGYVLLGSDGRMCQSNGQWNGTDPSCQMTGCPILTAPRFGDVKVTDTTLGLAASCSCRSGYRVVSGDTTRTCGDDGNWSGDRLTCKAITCDTLPPPTNGAVVISGTSFGDTATYSCNIGYVLYGKGIQVCGMDGQWGGEPAECKVIDCGPLRAPANGYVRVAGTTFGFSGQYTCDNGFVLNGFRSRVCQITGEWLGDDPQCTSQQCSQLPAPDNGAVVINNSVATYTCNAGFTLIGATTQHCSGGVWSDTPPTCGSVHCGEIQAINNGKFLYSNGTAVNSVATFSCNHGYALVGAATSTCQKSGMWSGSIPACQLQGVDCSCSSLEAPQNGNVQFAVTTYGATATYTCNQGYTLVGMQQRSCNSQGVWSGNTPSCAAAQVFSCGALPDPENGRVFYNNTVPGSQAVYVCNDGFTLSGAETRTCVEQDGWSKMAATCI